MATLDKAEALLEELRVASVEAARRDLDEVAAFAAEQACNPYPIAYPKPLARCHMDEVAAFASAQACDIHGFVDPRKK